MRRRVLGRSGPNVAVGKASLTFQSGVIGFGVLVLLSITLLATIPWSEQPPSPGLAREPLFADYAVPLSQERTVTASAVHYTAETAFWNLLPSAWKDGADWRFSFKASQLQPESVYVEGEKVEPRNSPNGPFYSIPARLIAERTSITVVGSVDSVPVVYLHWNRSYVYPAPRVAGIGVELLELNDESIPFQLMGTRLVPCQQASTSVIPFVKWCGHDEQVLDMTGSGWTTASLAREWPTSNSMLSLWVRPEARGHFNLFTNGDDAIGDNSLKLALDGPGTILVFTSTDGVYEHVLAGTQPLPLGLWSHIAISISDHELALYVNGVLDSHALLDSSIHATNRPIVVGSDFTSPGHYYYAFDGQIAGVKLSTQALGPADARQLYMADVVKDPSGNLSLGNQHLSPLGSPVVPWWQSHTPIALMLAMAYLVGFGLVTAWSLREVRRHVRSRAAIVALTTCVGVLTFASAVTTNYDVQLFKGLTEGYWINGPVPGLTLSGYGPAVDLLFTLPTLPYAMLSGWIGAHSEIALNLAIRLPFMAGWLFLIASVARLTASLQEEARGRFPWLLLLVNPLALVVPLWQPEAGLVGLIVLSVAMLLEGRPIAAGILLAVAFSGKYWPAVVGPILLLAAWRLLGRHQAKQFLVAACSTTFAIFLVYWLPTAVLLRSMSDFIELLVTRTPYFGGSHAEAEATIWSLYALPGAVLPENVGVVVSVAERWSLLVFAALYAILIVLCLRDELTRYRVVLAVGGALALLAGISSLSVPQFGLWSLPFILVAGSRLNGFAWPAIAASWCGAGVYLFAEPISYWLLHVSSAQDALAYSLARWLQAHVVNPRLGESLGFMFAFLLVVSAGYVLAELVRDGRHDGGGDGSLPISAANTAL